MDATRGTAIILVIVFHAIVEVDLRTDLPGWTQVAADIIAPARLPVVVFLSGLLLAKSLSKPVRRYLAGKVSRILWPFLLWTLIMTGLFVAAEPVTGAGWGWGDLPMALVSPIDHLWYLRDLFVFYLLALTTRRVPPSVMACIALLCCAAAFLLGVPGLTRATYLFFFFMLGYWLVTEKKMWNELLKSRVALLVASALSLAVIPAAVFLGDIRYEFVFLPMTAGMGLLLARTMRRFGSAKFLEPLQSVGTNSMSYYLVHWPVILFLARGLPEPLYAHDPFLLLLLVTLASLGAGRVLSSVTSKLRPFESLLSLPFIEAKATAR